MDLSEPERPVTRSGVLVLSGLFPRPGRPLFGSFVFEQARELARGGGGVRVVVPVARHERFRHGSGEDVGQLPSDPNLPVDYLPWLQLPGNPGLVPSGELLARRLRAFLEARGLQPGLIHAHDALPCGHAALLLKRSLGIPYVVTAHGRDAFFEKQLAGVGLSRVGARVARAVFTEAAAVVCVSDLVADVVQEGTGGEARVEVVYNGFDPEVFHPGAGTRAVGGPVLLSVGNLHRTKGQHLVIEALPSIRDAFPDVRYLLAGEGPYRGELERLARTLGVAGQVRFLGRQPRAEVARLMAASDLFVLPSYDEAFGCVYVEAMGTGTPVVACKGQGGALIVDDGVDGFLVDPTAQAVGAAVLTVLGDPGRADAVGREALTSALSRFTWAASAAALRRVYGDVISGPLAGSHGAVSAVDAAATSASGL